MHTALRALAAGFVLVCAVVAVRADLRPGGRRPEPPKPVAAPLVVLIDDKAKEPRLEIPRNLLIGGRAALDDEGDLRRAETPRLHMLIAGIALSLSLAAAGFWLVRSGNRFSRGGVAVLLVAGALLTVGGVTLWANGLPPPQPPGPAKPPVMPQGVVLGDNVVIDLLPRGDAIRLIVSKKQLQDVLDKSSAKPEAPKAGAQPKPE
jgi:hypothetical protein